MIETAINLDNNNKPINDSTDKSSTSNDTAKNDDNQPTLVLKNKIYNGQLFGPFSDPIQWLAIRQQQQSSSTCKTNLPKEITNNLDNDLVDLFASIQMANGVDEQNMEIIVNKNKFYFRAMHDIEQKREDVDDDDDDKNVEIKNDKNKKLFAWFSSELSGKLPTPGVSLINGNKRYFCTKCNQVFIYPNPAILHILFACTNINSSIDNVQSTSPNNFVNKLTANSDIITPPPISSSNNNESISLTNSKILKNLEVKLCKQFNANISPGSSESVPANSKPTTTKNSSKKRSSFDIDSLVNSGGQSSSSDHGKKQKSKSDSKQYKTSSSTPVTSFAAATGNLNNSTLINSLNSPLISANNNYLNPFSFLDPTTAAAAASLASSAFHKFDNNNLIKSSDQNSLLNAAAMFSHPNFANPYDLTTSSLYAQHQRNSNSSLLQSLYLQSAAAAAAAANNPLFASQNLTNLNIQNSLASSLFGLGTTTNNLNGFGGLDLFNLPAAVSATQASSNQSNSTSSSSSSLTSVVEKNQAKKSKKSKEGSKSNPLQNNDNQNSLTKLTQQLQSQGTQSIPPSYLQFLPPSLAALSYPQSNWCAKCSIGFRMTSDLVYHMRSQHKDSSAFGNSAASAAANGQTASPTKRKREENKLFCTICGEGFRER